ncbi:MAG: flagellar M-ring protein FliF [Balneolia bacterium]|nr:flagellar M-ring protein FliF [Balneolia bacterium]
MSSAVEKFQAFIGPLNPAQRSMFAGLAVVFVVLIGLMFYWALKPDYTLLFGSMQPDIAANVVEQLDAEGVSYRLENGGASIYVHSDKVHELRLRLASSGLIQSDIKGYELFDENALGMTDFMQQVNKKRALEGELARSINSIDQVDFSRIHLVLPERRPFQQTSVAASASVILTMRNGARLSQDQVKGMVSLIAGSVEGLEPDDVVILDQSGNRLTDSLRGQGGLASGSMQLELRETVEAYLTERAQTMLDISLGPGNSLVRVSVEHDFDRIVRESDIIDPDSRTIISEERRSESLIDEASQQVPIDEFTPINQRGQTVVVNNRNNESSTQTRNYEVNRTREVFERSHGDIKRISASILLNQKRVQVEDENGNMVWENQPFPQDELNEFREVVRVALGMQPTRGDELTLTQLVFHDPRGDFGDSFYVTQPLQTYEIIRWSLVIITFLIVIALIYSIRKRIAAGNTQLITTMPNEQFDNLSEQTYVINDEEDEETPEFIDKKNSGKIRKQLEEKTFALEEIKDFVELKPLEAAQVLRAMMIKDES